MSQPQPQPQPHCADKDSYWNRFLNHFYFGLGMTMDIHQRGLRGEAAAPYPPAMRPAPDKGTTTPSISPVTDIPSAPKKPAKRSFDVAFLMAPDDLSTKKRHQQQLKMATSVSQVQRYSPANMRMAQSTESVEIKISRSMNNQRLMSGRGHGEYPPHPTSPLGLLIPSPKGYQNALCERKDQIIDITQDDQSQQFAKSAFTKVKGGRLDFTGQNMPASPSSVSSTVSGGGLSPDMAYQESLSPPITGGSSRSPVHYLQPPKPLNPNMAYFATSGKSCSSAAPDPYFYGHASKEKIEGKLSNTMDGNGFLGNFMHKGPDPMHKLRPMLYQGDNLPYGGIPLAAYPFPPNFPPSGPAVPTHTLLSAAASVTAALLPPALAALSLPAQNVCAKCKISFRMTSDLVYHMRSHHKGEHVAVDSTRRRRDQDKLRCPVCNETFRERHHLTRHMTAHQDKEGDHDDVDDALELNRRRK